MKKYLYILGCLCILGGGALLYFFFWTDGLDGLYSPEQQVVRKLTRQNKGKPIKVACWQELGQFVVKIELFKPAKYNLTCLNQLDPAYQYDVTLIGFVGSIPDITSLAIQRLVVCSTGNSAFTWPAGKLSGVLKNFAIEDWKCYDKVAGLPDFSGLEDLSLSFGANTTFDVKHLEQYKKLKELIIGQAIENGEAGEKKITFTNKSDVALPELSTLFIVGNCSGVENLFHSANIKVLTFLMADVDASFLAKHISSLTQLTLINCRVTNESWLDKMRIDNVVIR